MFDNQPTGQGNASAPGADDIFSGLDQGSTQVQPQPQAQFSVEDMSQVNNQAPVSAANVHEAGSKRLVLVGGIVIGLLFLAIGIWLVLMGFKIKNDQNISSLSTASSEKAGLVVPAAKTESAAQKTMDAAVSGNATVEQGGPVNPTSVNPTAVMPNASITPTSTAVNGLPTEPAKTATTELSSIPAIPEAVKQAASGNIDSDGDGLSDYDEINKYFTDPKNPDTDGDGFTDGAEIKNGYNPCGQGKLPSADQLKKECAKYRK